MGLLNKAAGSVRNAAPAGRRQSAMPTEPVDAKEMIRQLKKAGWVGVKTTVWKSPSGSYYLGPYQAWKQMQRHTR